VSNLVRCKGPRCKKTVLFAIDEEGKRIPLDSSAPVYRVSFAEDGTTLRATRDRNCMVSHFSTCVDVGKF
jgi:hypothetical protein